MASSGQDSAPHVSGPSRLLRFTRGLQLGRDARDTCPPSGGVQGGGDVLLSSQRPVVVVQVRVDLLNRGAGQLPCPPGGVQLGRDARGTCPPSGGVQGAGDVLLSSQRPVVVVQVRVDLLIRGAGQLPCPPGGLQLGRDARGTCPPSGGVQGAGDVLLSSQRPVVVAQVRVDLLNRGAGQVPCPPGGLQLGRDARGTCPPGGLQLGRDARGTCPPSGGVQGAGDVLLSSQQPVVVVQVRVDLLNRGAGQVPCPPGGLQLGRDARGTCPPSGGVQGADDVLLSSQRPVVVVQVRVDLLNRGVGQVPCPPGGLPLGRDARVTCPPSGGVQGAGDLLLSSQRPVVVAQVRVDLLNRGASPCWRLAFGRWPRPRGQGGRRVGCAACRMSGPVPARPVN
ncbi:hypothetical protein EAH72_34540, partial [Pseudomonas caspiana]